MVTGWTVRVVVRSRVDIVVVAVYAVEEVPVFRPESGAGVLFLSVLPL
jgi:hypothetical protein